MSDIPFICDSGTGYVKCGRANHTFPQFSYPAIVGRPLLRYDQKVGDVELKSIMIGDEASPYRNYLEMSNPTEEAVVKNWDDMLLVWDYGFKKQNIIPKETSIVLTEPVLCSAQHREKMVEVFFENFQFNKLQIGIQALLSLYAEGLMTGTLIDSGDGLTHCIPVFEGYIQNHAVQKLPIAGRHVTQRFVKLLQLRGYAFNSTADFELVKELKEKYSFCSANFLQDKILSEETTIYEKEVKLPDGTIINLGQERFLAPEVLFQPYLEGKDWRGASEIVFDAINACAMDIRSELYGQVVVSGGSSMFPGFPTRLENDLNRIYKEEILKGVESKSNKVKIKINDPPRRRYNVFIGAGVLAMTMKDSSKWWLSKQDYDECGKSIVKRIANTM